MTDQVEELLRAGAWLGPAVLGALCCRLLTDGGLTAAGDDMPGAMMLALGAVVLTIAGTRFNNDKHAAFGPAIFAAMFLASWSLR
jgi:hypothetical protein